MKRPQARFPIDQVPRWLGGDLWGKCAFCAGDGVYERTWMTMKCAGAGELTRNSCRLAGEMLIDPHSQASLYSHRPIGLGRDELKWEIPGGLCRGADGGFR